MKKFTTEEIRDLFNQVMLGEISFSRMVEVMNEGVSEAEKKCIEEIPKRRFNVGDKVVLKSGYKKQDGLKYLADFDRFIGKPLTIGGYTDIGNVCFSDCPYIFDEDWLEPYEELKEGDLAIFWDSNKESAMIGKYDYLNRNSPFKHKDKAGNIWKNAIKFESIGQYERLIKGEI